MVKLKDIKKGQRFKICKFDSEEVEIKSCVFGIECGKEFSCVAKPGAIVLKKYAQEIAIGKGLSEKIYVQAV